MCKRMCSADYWSYSTQMSITETDKAEISQATVYCTKNALPACAPSTPYRTTGEQILTDIKVSVGLLKTKVQSMQNNDVIKHLTQKKAYVGRSFGSF